MRTNALRIKNGEPAAEGRSDAGRYPRLRIAVVLVWVVFSVYCFYRLTEEPVIVVASAAAIATAALFPAYLWSEGVVPGLPILPLHTLVFLWTHALPLVAGHPEISFYDADEVLYSTFCVGLYVVFATIVWISIATRPVAARVRYYVLPRNRGYVFFVSSIGLGGLFTAATVFRWVEIDPGFFGIVRSSVLAFASIALFVLAVRVARGTLSPLQRVAFWTFAVFYVIFQIASLYLVGAIVSVASALIGYTIGRRRVPWATILAAFVLFGILHSGKGEMRDWYWAPGSPILALADLPEFFGNWVAAGTQELAGSEETLGYQPIHERVSLMHILLLVQRRSPDDVPYLKGSTYGLIPHLLVPRILDPDKPQSHLGTVMLNVHYGIQSEEDTERTTIAWGVLNEAYANFGIAGVAGIAILMGVLFGLAGKLTVGAPLMSLENMIGVTFAAIAIQSEFTMGVFVTVLFQSLVVLVLVVPFLDKRPAGATD